MTVWPYLTADRKYPPHLSLGCLKGRAHITLLLTSLFHKNLSSCIDLSWLLCIVHRHRRLGSFTIFICNVCVVLLFVCSLLSLRLYLARTKTKKYLSHAYSSISVLPYCSGVNYNLNEKLNSTVSLCYSQTD